MVTLKDVGELAGVTATTASAALRGKDYVKPETTQRVCDAARKLGYKINLSGRSLRSGVFRQVGVSCLVMYFFRV